jgi:hypothetical protein
MLQSASDFILAGAAEPQGESIQFLQVDRRIHQATQSTAMAYTEKMSHLMKTDLGSPHVHTVRFLVLESAKRDHSCHSSQLRFSVNELENRSADVTLNDPEFEPCTLYGFNKPEDLSC